MESIVYSSSKPPAYFRVLTWLPQPMSFRSYVAIPRCTPYSDLLVTVTGARVLCLAALNMKFSASVVEKGRLMLQNGILSNRCCGVPI